jgi:hypothetical protein
MTAPICSTFELPSFPFSRRFRENAASRSLSGRGNMHPLSDDHHGGIPVYLDIDGTCDYFHFEVDVSYSPLVSASATESVNFPLTGRQSNTADSLHSRCILSPLYPPGILSSTPIEIFTVRSPAKRRSFLPYGRRYGPGAHLRDLSFVQQTGTYRPFPTESSRHPYAGRSFFIPG